MDESLPSDCFLLLAKVLFLDFIEHSKDVKAIRNSKHPDKEYQKEDSDVYEHVNYHSYESCGLLEHPHEIK